MNNKWRFKWLNFGTVLVASIFTVLLWALGVFTLQVWSGNGKAHNEVMNTTLDASSGSGLVRVRQTRTVSADGVCTITVQRYVRYDVKQMFLRPPEVETLPCIVRTM
ncbi:MAG: hypothetical protein K9M10_01625 [Candidatus Pacebacteria bacterium]|nr:hypothetical protein [Candidatus Paceibacterota bacterium]MCF7857163.1 hypothetical protein [Candidatus Paceibacterota bacterium]